MDFARSHSWKMQLWPVEHFFPFVMKKVFNWSELHLSEVTSYKIHTLSICENFISRKNTSRKRSCNCIKMIMRLKKLFYHCVKILLACTACTHSFPFAPLNAWINFWTVTHFQIQTGLILVSKNPIWFSYMYISKGKNKKIAIWQFTQEFEQWILWKKIWVNE